MLHTEILDVIFEYTYCVGATTTVSPMVVTSNWKSEFNEVRCQTRRWDEFLGCCGVELERGWHAGSLVRFEHLRDEFGPYTELRRILRKDLDATGLRTNRYFNEAGTKLLYGNNQFLFHMGNPGWHSSPPTLLEDGTRRLRGPADMAPGTPRSLEGWAYFDPFLRFLYAIGRKNASYIKNLTFVGDAKIHCCLTCECKGCDDDLVGSVRVYIPFLIQLCTNLESLTLVVFEDITFKRKPHDLVDGRAHNTEQAVLPLLEEIRSIPSLKKLKVLLHAGSDVADADFAAPTVQWLAERAVQKSRNARSAELKEQAALVAAANLHCGFCGEGHTWPECYNLCDFCGAFGHFRSSCEAWSQSVSYPVLDTW
ncbi:hypothetical protein D0Z07_8632 [Hyphodiscus hymeniophilus]|uniref:Uncharacterized protein n=1 Tax=Hyphodiscus hymeniophilus TaxID=353542 RepID=A0A9P6SQA0_9HELO|nr:hypothetical protein D0Z07_8632 [Hyphodiscus hymeniophilus]